MRSIVFEGSTWRKYEKLRKNDKILHKKFVPNFEGNAEE